MDGIKELIDRLTLEEKISLLSGKNNWQSQDFPEYEIEAFFMADGPCGLRKQTGRGDHLGIEDSVAATALVSGACLAATWNPDRARDNGRILGSEAALQNVDIMLAPAMNIVRSPLCGRNFEYLSEDPFLTGEIATAYTRGIQAEHVGACPKHFAANNQETEREYIDAQVEERALREIYLPAFEKVVREAKPVAIMTALNQINGAYGAEHYHLMTDILRNEWDFAGITISDWYGVVHRDRAVRAGLDLEMPATQGVGEKQILKAVQEGRLREEEIDIACERLLRAVERIMEDRKQRAASQQNPASVMRRNHDLVRKIAEEGIVLLKNEDHILPLNPQERVLVIGPGAVHPKLTLDGSARVICTEMDIPLEKMRAISKVPVNWVEGYRKGATSAQSDQLAREAVLAAGDAQKVIFFMEQGDGVEHEGQDRSDLCMPADQAALLGDVCKRQPNTIVVLVNASPVEMPWRDKVPAILECFLAGQGFGRAIARILYGEVNPSGKLPVSFTRTVEDTSAFFSFPGDGRRVTYLEGVFVGYRYYDRKHTDVLYPFGYGLSYTQFEYSAGVIRKEFDDADQWRASISIQVKNAGEFPGAEVVQLYVSGFDTDVRRPVRELRGFQKVYLQPGEEKEVSFNLKERDLTYYDEYSSCWVAPDGPYQIEIGSSSRDIRWQDSFELMSEKYQPKRLTAWSHFGELKRAKIGEQHYLQGLGILKECMTEDTVFLRRADLEQEDKMDQLPMRFLNLLTNGLIDNDMLLGWVDDVNRAIMGMK